MAKKLSKNPLFIGAVVVVALLFFGVISLPENMSIPGFSVADTTADAGEEAPVVAQKVSDSVLLKLTEKYSESPSATGTVEVFAEGTNPKDSSATAIATITVGTAYTTGDLACGKTYRVVYNNATEAYAEDFGDVVLIDCATEYNDETADSFVDMTSKWAFKKSKVATLDDPFDETATSGILNGQTNTSILLGSNEIGCSADCSADGTILYDESQGDGQYYMDVTFSASGSQAELRDPVVCFEHDSSVPPEGNEITDIVMQRQSGTDLSIPASTDWDSVFNNEECVKLGGGIMTAGTSAVYRMTVTVSEANLDTNDDYKLIFDDLGDNRGKDARLNLGATGENIDFDAQA
tara:strand:- start:2114 stop:3163 length:1050 start_codon:yes stop_codon:yes gene_type:complete